MYVQPSFAVDTETAHDLLATMPFGHLITNNGRDFTVSGMPVIFDPTDGEFGVLRGHLARANNQWKSCDPSSPALMLFAGADGYISPNWYPSKHAHGKVVPTWNYTSVYVHGVITVHDDARWVRMIVEALTERHEADQNPPWSVDDAPANYIDAMLRAIVGIELQITRIDAKQKLSQNREGADRDGAIDELRCGSAAQQRLAVAMGATKQ